jgi:hypothetical protein
MSNHERLQPMALQGMLTYTLKKNCGGTFTLYGKSFVLKIFHDSFQKWIVE